MNRIKTILSKIKLPKVKLPKPRLPKLTLPKIKLPKVKIPKVSLPKIKIPHIKMPKISLPKIKINFAKIKPYLIKGFGLVKKIIGISLKAVKAVVRWFGKAVKESIAQVWTLLGFFIAWLTLTGTAQQIVGIATLAATALWLLTIPLREEKE